MEVGLKISVLFSNSERKVKNVPKYMLRVVSAYLYGRRIDWRRIFSSSIIEVIDPSWQPRFELIHDLKSVLGNSREDFDRYQSENKPIWLFRIALKKADRKGRGFLNSLMSIDPRMGCQRKYGEALAEMKAQCRANGLWNVSRLNKKELAHLLMTI